MAVLGQIIGFNPENGCIYFELLDEKSEDSEENHIYYHRRLNT